MALSSGTELAFSFRMKTSGAISHVNVQFVFSISETVSVPVIKGECDECCVHTSTSGD
jgi:hypothetical protein